MQHRKRADWPADEFRTYVEDAMRVRGIPSRAELSRLSGVGQQQLSTWWNGKAQPTRELLRKVAEPLGVPLAALEIKAGLLEPGELDTPPDDTILPSEIERVIDAYTTALESHPDLVDGLLERVAYAAEWFELKATR